MADLKEYTVDINGVEHTVQLTAEDAKRRGLTDKDVVKRSSTKAVTPANKAATPNDK